MADDQDNTQPINVEDLLGLNDDDVAEAKKLLPDASTARAAVVALLIFVGAAIGKPELGHEVWVDSFISAYVVVAPLALAWWIRRHTKSGSTGKHAKS